MTAVRDEAVDTVKSLAPTAEEKAALGVLGDIAADLKTLARQELELAKAETTAQAGKVGKGAGLLAGAAFGALMVVLFLSLALWWGLANVMDESWAALITAGVWLVITAVLAVVGRGVLKSISLKPERTINSLARIPDAFTTRSGDRP